jgi:GPH family glycoside/pentoside/hexuronide:cation symporter
MSESEKSMVKEKIPRGYLVAWSSRAVSLAVNIIFVMQLTYYATDFVGLSAGLVGALLLGSKIFDGITDLLVGFVINKTNTKLGKARPYELMIIPLWICTVLLFSVPDLGIVGKSVYIFLFYSLINSVCATFLNGTDAIYMSRSLANEQHRAKILSWSAILIMLSAAGIRMLFPQLIASWGPQQGGWTKISLVIGIPLLVIGLGRFFFVKETNIDAATDKEASKMSMKESLVALSKNKYIFILAGCLFFNRLIQELSGVIGVYYFRYVIGNFRLLSTIGMLGLTAPLVLLLFPVAMRKLGAMNYMRIGLAVSVVGHILKFFSGTNLGMLIAGQFMASLGLSPLGTLVNLFLIQCMDYNEWKTNKRVDGYMGPLAQFTNKVGAGVASGGLGFIMASAGYNGAAEVQSASAISVIVALYTWVPAIICVFTFFVMNKYDLDKKIPEIKEELARRKAHE